MSRLNENISQYTKFQLYMSAGIKLLCGVIYGMTIKNKGRLLIGRHVHIMNRQHIYLGRFVKFEDYSEVQGLSQNGIILGNNVTLGRSVQIRPSSYYGVGTIGKGLRMGNNSSIGPYGYIGCAGQIIIGENVMIGPNVTIIAENHNFKKSSLNIKQQGVHQLGITIEDNVWIGANVTILDGVTIGEGSVIGAATLVTKSIKKNSIYFDKRAPITKIR